MSMKFDRAIVSRKFNLGNYETLDMALEYQLAEGDNPKQILAELREAIEMEFIDMQRKKPAGGGGDNPRPTQPPLATASSPKPLPPASQLKWEEMPKTDTNKGIWQRCTQLSSPEVQYFIDKVEEANKPIFLNNYVYWVIYTDDLATGIGRRKT
jgi:hypothetical protein